MVVLVRCHHKDFVVLRRRFSGQRADDIVGLKAGRANNGNVECLHQTIHQRNLNREVFRQCVALSLVLGEHLMAKGGIVGVESDRHVGRLLTLDQIEYRVGDTKDSRCWHFAGSKARATDHSEVRAIDQRHPIKQIQFLRLAGGKQIWAGNRCGSFFLCHWDLCESVSFCPQSLAKFGSNFLP